MLSRLSVRDLALVERARVEFGPGLCVLTGETGAGKSLIVAALAALRGGRAGADLVRHGASAAVVEAVFDQETSARVAPLLAELGLDTFDPADGGASGELVLRRRVGRDGRSRALVNDHVVSLATLRTLGSLLIDLHGQHEYQLLLDESRHTSLLDAAGGLAPSLKALRTARTNMLRARDALRAAAQAREERSRRAAELATLVAEVEAVDPAPDEIEHLRAERERLRHADRIVEGLRALSRLLSEDEGSALERIGVADGFLRYLEAIDPALVPVRQELTEAQVLIAEVVRTAERRLAEFEGDPGERLGTIENRLIRLESLARRHGTLAAARAAADAARHELAAEGGADEATLVAGAADALTELRKAARRLTSGRTRTAVELARAVEAELVALGFPAGAFKVALSPWVTQPAAIANSAGREDAAGLTPQTILDGATALLGAIRDDGEEIARFLLAPNPGEGFHPLGQTAAGGELARVMLALRTALQGEGGAQVLVFDEVDTGVGGIVLDAVGDRLAALAAHRQVLCVTHQARIAARAHLHLRVDKHIAAGRTVTRVVPLEESGRLAEIERLLAGRAPGPRARALAAELLHRHRPGTGRRRAAPPAVSSA